MPCTQMAHALPLLQRMGLPLVAPALMRTEWFLVWFNSLS